MIDASFTDMAINLYESSFKRLNINNYLFIGTGKQACITLHQFHINCFYFTDDTNSNTSNIYNSREFNQKLNIRTLMILQALDSGFSVLHIDSDVVFIKNPMPEIEKNLSKHDMMLLWDDSAYNAGFLSINPTNFTKEVYKHVQEKTNKSAKLIDQQALNQVINEMYKRYPKNYSEKVVRLDPNKYLCGKKYFEAKDRNFPPAEKKSDNCAGCLVVHNNWIVSKEAKEYRFKEALMWWVDKEKYYSDTERKYLSYANPLLSKPTAPLKLHEVEIEALKTAFAISQILNRTLILPRFHCIKVNTTKECSLLNHLSIRDLDKKFLNKYRENSFFLHHLIPQNLSNFESFYRNQHNLKPFEIPPVYTILTKYNRQFIENLNYSHTNILDVKFKENVEENDIIDKLGNVPDKVVHFTSLMGVKVSFTDEQVSEEFINSTKKGFLNKGYRQF